MNQLPVQRASELSIDSASLTQWLVQGLWSDQAVGILGGEPKCYKSFLALDLAVSVASGAPCLRRFVVRRTGPVLLFPAEDSLAVVRRRLEGICSAAGVDFQALPVEIITAPTLRLDAPTDRERLSNTVPARQPRLLILDPLIRLHRVDENDASQIAGLLLLAPTPTNIPSGGLNRPPRQKASRRVFPVSVSLGAYRRGKGNGW